MWLVSIERSFQGLSVAIKTVRINEELMEIWPNEVCDTENQTDVQAFIGFVNFYHHFIWDFSTIARPPLWPYSFWQGLKLGCQRTESLWTSQDGGDHRSGPGITSGLRTIPHQGWQFQFRLRSHLLSATTWRGEMAPDSLLQQIPVSSGTKLQDPWQGDAYYHLRTRRVEAFPERSLAPSRDLDRPQESGVFHDN